MAIQLACRSSTETFRLLQRGKKHTFFFRLRKAFHSAPRGKKKGSRNIRHYAPGLRIAQLEKTTYVVEIAFFASPCEVLKWGGKSCHPVGKAFRGISLYNCIRVLCVSRQRFFFSSLHEREVTPSPPKKKNNPIKRMDGGIHYWVTHWRDCNKS